MAEADHLLASPIAERVAPEGAEVEDIYGMASPVVIEDPLLEYTAVREGVGLLDFSPLLKVDVEGPGARNVINRLHSRDLSKVAVGRIAYGTILNEQGGVIDDSTVMVRGEDRIRVVGGPNMPAEVLRIAAAHGLQARERRAELAHLNIQGPRSRELLSEVVDIDVSNAAFPYYTFKESVDVAGVEDVFITRMGYTAELGYELFIPVAGAVTVYDALAAAGAKYGFRPVGVAAIMMIRLEAGMVMGEFEYDASVSPWECSLGWTVNLDKGDFQGRDAVLALREERVDRLVSVVLGGGEDAATGAVLHLPDPDGRTIGRVSMAMPSPHLDGRTLGLARVHGPHANPGTSVVARVGDADIPGDIVSTPVYDPGRTRVKS